MSSLIVNVSVSVHLGPNKTKMRQDNLPPVGPTETKHFSSQGALVGQHVNTLHEVKHTQQTQFQCCSTWWTNGPGGLSPHLLTSLSPSPAAPLISTLASPCEPFTPTPADYSGDLGTRRQFLHHCSLVFASHPC